MEKLKKILHERRSVRRYERRPIESEKLDFIYEAIRNTPTSYNGQQFSVIAVSDQAIKEELYEITGQKQIKTSAIFLVFCLDYNKLRVAGELKEVKMTDYSSTIDGYTVGVIDASLAMMNATVAAESLGLGSCCVGYIRTADPKKVSAILGLPKGVAIVCGLTIGYPNEKPDLKPKLPMDLVVYPNSYMRNEEMVPRLIEYDNRVMEFNLARAGEQTSNDWITHILDYHKEAKKHSIADYLKDQISLK